VQRAVAAAARRAGIDKPCSPHVLRHYLPFLTMSCAWPRASCFADIRWMSPT